MDEEDVRELEESKTLSTSAGYTGFGSTETDAARRAGLMDLLRPAGGGGEETMGVRLLKKMGWKEGQGVGPKVRRRADLDEHGSGETYHLFAPKNPPLVSFVHKTDHKGLGYQGEARLISSAGHESDDDDDGAIGRMRKGKVNNRSRDKKRIGGFGVGVLNDTGSDDEDPYSLGPAISYSRTIGGDKNKKNNNKKKKNVAKTVAAPSTLPSNNNLQRPIFISKKNAGFRRGHDGRLPLDGFVLADGLSRLSLGKKYGPPEIPEGWKSSKKEMPSRSQHDTSNYISTKEAAKASTLDPTSRAALLGEAQMPGKSIFDWVTPEGRERIARLTGKNDLPPALSEKAPKGYESTDAQKHKDLWDLVPKLDKSLAVQALTRAVSGWMPYAENEEKRERYRSFLEVRAGLRNTLPDRVSGSSTEEWIAEMEEFTRAAEVFRPMSGIMASRFTPSSKSTAGGAGGNDADALLQKPAEKPESPGVAAAKLGMFGPMTRSSQTFAPCRLLCKRFNVKPPDTTTSQGETREQQTKELIPRHVVEQLRAETTTTMPARESGAERKEPQRVVEPEHNSALEGERPGEAVFRAIFGDDSSSSSEGE